MSGQRDQLDESPPAKLGRRLGVLRVRESPRSHQSPSDLDKQSIAFGQPVERPVRPHGIDCLLWGSLLVRAVLVSCPGIARLHLPRRDQDHQLAVSRRQVAVESEVVFQGANTIGQLRHVHQDAERTAYAAPHGGDAVPDSLVLARKAIAIRCWQTRHGSGKRIRVSLPNGRRSFRPEAEPGAYGGELRG